MPLLATVLTEIACLDAPDVRRTHLLVFCGLEKLKKLSEKIHIKLTNFPWKILLFLRLEEK